MKDREKILMDYKQVRATAGAVLLDLDGDQAWFPRWAVSLNPRTGKAEIDASVFREKFPKG